MKLLKTVLLIMLISGCATVKVRHTGDTMEMSFKTEAQQVVFYGSDNGYAPVQTENRNGWWYVAVRSTKKLKYFLKTDGQVYLPECRMKEQDDFGGELCIYER